jgi:hypothetical protein
MIEKPPKQPLPVPMSEDFLANRFAGAYGDRLRFVRQWRRWYVRHGDGWQEDAKNVHCHYAVLLMRGACYWPEATELTPPERRALDSRKAAWSMLALAGTDPRIAATSEDVGVPPPVRWQRKKLARKPKPRP